MGMGFSYYTRALLNNDTLLEECLSKKYRICISRKVDDIKLIAHICTSTDTNVIPNFL